MRNFDLVIVGAGVAGLTAATFAGRYGLKVAVVEQVGAGGQIINAERIENFPGFPHGLGGHELGPLLHEQADVAGAEFVLDLVEALELDGEHRIVRAASERLRARRSSSPRIHLASTGSGRRGEISRPWRIAPRLLRWLLSLRASRFASWVAAIRRSMKRWCYDLSGRLPVR